MQHFDTVRRIGDRIDMAKLVNNAVWKPESLNTASERHKELTRSLPGTAEAMATGLAILNAHRATQGLPPLTEFPR